MKNTPKKSLGQNFLKDPKILRKIVDFAQIEKEDLVVEVGPGEGTLTEILVEQAKKVVAIEKDTRMVEFIKSKFKKEIGENRLEIIEADALEIELKNKNYVLVGNIPYYITGALFKKVLESENQPKSLTFVVQKEVAERIMAKDGKESILSISIKAYGEAKYGGLIRAGSFFPAPKVDSAILSLRNVSKKRFEENNVSEKAFFEVLRAGFAHKRKLLINNLNLKPEIFEKLKFSPKTRAEDLVTEDWFKIAHNLNRV